MYIFELADIMLFISNTSNYKQFQHYQLPIWTFSRSTTRPSSSGFNSIHNLHQTIKLGVSISIDSHGYETHSHAIIYLALASYLLTLRANLNITYGNQTFHTILIIQPILAHYITIMPLQQMLHLIIPYKFR